jgi:hypothetical protein
VLGEGLPRRVRAVVQQVLGEARGKCDGLLRWVRAVVQQVLGEARGKCEGLPRWFRAVVQQVLREARGKRDLEALDAGAGSGLNTETPFCSLGNTSRPIKLGGGEGHVQHELSATLLSSACL